MRNYKKLNRKGVSPVIATLLLILIAVAAAVLVYMWVTGYVRTTATGGEEMAERIKIEAVSVSSGSLTAYVRNVGDVTATINAIYVIDRGGSILGSSTGLSSSVGVGSITTVTVSATLTRGQHYTLRVVTKSGVEASYVFRVQ
ncbi:MAG: archaellin/type IV pilin N-terminal domain-containing protein [Candidatus Methanomethylicia archaeon]